MKTKSSTKTVGIDLGDRKHAICVLSAAGEILTESKITGSRDAMTRLSKKHPGVLVVMEVGMQSPWISRLFEGLGHRVLVANPRKVRAIYKNDRKSDRKDAIMLAKLARADESLLCPIGRDAGYPAPPRRLITAPGSSGMRAGGTSTMVGSLSVEDPIRGGAGLALSGMRPRLPDDPGRRDPPPLPGFGEAGPREARPLAATAARRLHGRLPTTVGLRNRGCRT